MHVMAKPPTWLSWVLEPRDDDLAPESTQRDSSASESCGFMSKLCNEIGILIKLHSSMPWLAFSRFLSTPAVGIDATGTSNFHPVL